MMMLREGRAGLLLLSVSSFLLLGASGPLNPTVKVLEHPTAMVSSDCVNGLAPQKMARLEPAEIPEPVRRVVMESAPPQATLRSLLTETQTTAAGGDREGFRDALARAKAAWNAYPNGAEKTAAADVVRVYDDIDRLWTYLFETPTGSFFDASSGLLQMMSAYPDYRKAIDDQTLVVQGTRLYPTKETRDFLVREAGARLARVVGGQTALPRVATSKPKPSTNIVDDKSRALPRIAIKKPKAATTNVVEDKSRALPRVSTRKPKTAVVEDKSRALPRVSTKKPKTAVVEDKSRALPRVVTKSAKSSSSSTAPKKSVSHPPVKIAKASPPPAPVWRPVPAPVPPPIATTTTAAPPRIATTTTAAPAPPPVSAPLTQTTATEAPITATETTDTSTTTAEAMAPAETTETTETTASAATSTQPAPRTSPFRNVVLPIILIVIGIGVLIVLFRASS